MYSTEVQWNVVNKVKQIVQFTINLHTCTVLYCSAMDRSNTKCTMYTHKCTRFSARDCTKHLAHFRESNPCNGAALQRAGRPDSKDKIKCNF